MQTAPANWNSLWSRLEEEDVILETRAVIGGISYTGGRIISCKAYPAAFDSLAIGQAVSAQLDLSFVPLGAVPKAAKIQLSARLTDGSISTSWVPQGTYYIDDRDTEMELGVLSVTAFDRMMFAEELYFSSGTITGVWPRAANLVVSEICTRLGISLDSRTVIDSSLMIPMPVNLTMRDVLREIAAAHGGNFIIIPSNTLRLLPFEDLPDLTLLGDEFGNFVADEYGNRVLIIEGEFADMPCEDARSMGDRVKISRVVLTLDDEHAFTAGDESGYTLTANCLAADQAAANRALARVKGIRYDPSEVTGAVFNPLLELGDTLYSGGVLFRVYRMEIDYDILCTADLSAPIQGDVEHEIPYQNSTERLINWKIAQTRAYINMSLEELELGVKNEMEGMYASINIQLTSITSRVQGAEGNISTLTQTANSLQSQITNARGDISTLTQTATSLQSQITNAQGNISTISQKVDNIRLEVTNGESASWISLSVDGIEVSSPKKIQFTGDVVFESALRNGSTTISGDCIQTGEISSEYIRLGGAMTIYEDFNGGFYGGQFGYIEGRSADGNSTSGVGIMYADYAGQLLCTNAGARLGYGSSTSVTCTSGRVSLTGPEIVVNGTLKNSDGTVITSDRNLKEDIREDLDAYLNLFNKLQPVSFRLKNRDRRHLGFIAQDVEAAMEASGIESADFAALVKDGGGVYGLRYEEFIPLLVAKIQRLEREMAEMEIARLKKQLRELRP